MNLASLYKFDLNRNVLEWNITYDKDDPKNIMIVTGYLTGNKVTTISPISMSTAEAEINSRVNVKRKAGWKTLKDLGINENTNFSTESLEKILSGKLEYNHTDLNNARKPQKAILFDSKRFTFPGLLQRKLNGVRCTIGWYVYTKGEGLFEEQIEGVRILSKEGMEYVMPHISVLFIKEDFIYKDLDRGEIVNIIYDGELYCHGMKLNEIRKCIPYINNKGTLSKPSGNPLNISFWSYDLAIPDYVQYQRLIVKNNLLQKYVGATNYIYPLPHKIVYSATEAKLLSDEYIEQRYEGGILRDYDSYYGFGKKDARMMKIKKWIYTKCTILDVILKNETTINDKTRTYVALLLKNDVNEETFECTPDGDEERRLWLLSNKNNIIGNQIVVKYRERSGISNCPFQAVATEILN